MQTREHGGITVRRTKKGTIRASNNLPDRPEGGRDGEPDNPVPLWCLLKRHSQAASVSPNAVLIFINWALTPLSAVSPEGSKTPSGPCRSDCSLRRLFRTALWNSTALRPLGPDIVFFSSSITSNETRCAAKTLPSGRSVNPCIATLRDDQAQEAGKCILSRRYGRAAGRSRSCR